MVCVGSNGVVDTGAIVDGGGLIIDTDAGIDDVLAILFALARSSASSRSSSSASSSSAASSSSSSSSPCHPPPLANPAVLPGRVVAITLTFGNTTLDHAEANVLRLYHVLERACDEDVEVAERFGYLFRDEGYAGGTLLARGAERPLRGERFSASYFHGADGLSSISSLPDDPFPVPRHTPSPLRRSELDAADALLSLLRRHPARTLSLVAIGPLTNLALAKRRDPATFARARSISVMGGALDRPGNTTPTAEFNLFADPWAAHELLVDSSSRFAASATGTTDDDRRGPRIALLPLDVTHRHAIPFETLCDGALARGGNALHRFLAHILAGPRRLATSSAAPRRVVPVTNGAAKEDGDGDGFFVPHDVLAVAHARHANADDERGGRRVSAVEVTNGSNGGGGGGHDGGNDGGRLGGWQTRLRRFGIETEGVLTRGMCVVDRRVTRASAPASAAADAVTSGKTTGAEYAEVEVLVASPREGRRLTDELLHALAL